MAQIVVMLEEDDLIIIKEHLQKAYEDVAMSVEFANKCKKIKGDDLSKFRFLLSDIKENIACLDEILFRNGVGDSDVE